MKSDATTKKSRRKEYITILSVLASFAVVMLHVNSFWFFRKSGTWIVANIIESVMYFAVPVFFMISGATLINYRKRYTTKQFFVKRIKRTVIPFLVWSVFGTIYYFANGGEWTGIRGLISGILACKYVDIYWFFPALFAVYLAMPFVSLIPEEKRKQGFGYAIIAGIVLNSVLPLLSVLLGIDYSISFIFPLVGYITYALIGYWIDNYRLSQKTRRWIYICGLLGLIVHIVGTQILSYEAGSIVQTFKGYLNVPCIIYSVAIFVFFRYFNKQQVITTTTKLVAPIVPLTYGIYLVQFLIIQTINRSGWFDATNLVYTFVGTIAVYAVCAGITFVLSKIPLLKEIV